jgi:putrescine transport system ATP-binding protein
MLLQEKLGLTFIIVTHDQQEAMTLADRIAVMNHGRLIQVATPAEIYEQPNSRWVADFIGNVNLLEGRVLAHAPGGTLIAGPAGARLRAFGGQGQPGDTVWLALRPEKVRISHEQPPSTEENCLAGQVRNVAYLGDLSMYTIQIADDIVMKATVTNVTRSFERSIDWDDGVWLTWSGDAGLILTQ